MKYEIKYSEEATKQLRKLDKQIVIQIAKRLVKLSENPFLAKPLCNEFKNYRSEHIGKFRIIFSTQENKIIIAKIEHRKTVYG